MAYQPVFVMSDGERASNSQVFETKQEALDSAADRFRVWTMPVSYDAEECKGPANYHRVDGRDKRMERLIYE
jgi:hypothetical protein